MSVLFAEDHISFQGTLTQQEINQIVKKGEVKRLQTDKTPLNVSTLRKLNEEYFSKFPDTELRIYTYEDCDLSSLSVMNKVRKISLETSSNFLNMEAIYSLDGIRHLHIKVPKLQDDDFLKKISDLIETLELNIENKSFDLQKLSRFTRLKTLGLYR